MLNTRLGAVPLIEVNTPSPFAESAVYRSSQNGKMVMLKVASGKQMLLKEALLLTNWKVPLEPTLALVKAVPYRLYVNGKVMVVTPSSVWLPVSIVPGTIATPVACVIT